MLRFRIFLAAFAATVALPVQAQICTPFIDVPASDPFCTNIQWMFNRGVTFGCTGNQYCPANPVRRDQMAAFIYRLAHDVVFQDGGNAFGNPAVLGTTDNQPLDIRVNNVRVMRLQPGSNVVGGHPANNVSAGVVGGTVGGGGMVASANSVTGDQGPSLVELTIPRAGVDLLVAVSRILPALLALWLAALTTRQSRLALSSAVETPMSRAATTLRSPADWETSQVGSLVSHSASMAVRTPTVA